MTDIDPIAEASVPISRHVNGEHTENLIEYLNVFADVSGVDDARMLGVDRHGMEIEARTPAGVQVVKIPWRTTLDRREQVREEMVAMTIEAKAKLGLEPPNLEAH